MPGIPENRHRFTAVYRLGPPALLLLTTRDAALDFGGFCADLLTGLDFVGMPGKLLRSKAGCKGAIAHNNEYFAL
jgi:hypothetical protein